MRKLKHRILKVKLADVPENPWVFREWSEYKIKEGCIPDFSQGEKLAHFEHFGELCQQNINI